MKKRWWVFVLCGALLSCSAALHAEEAEDETSPFSGSATLVNDYIWRGVSQSDEDPAIQAGFELSHTGFYVGGWGSSVDFDEEVADDADLELDGMVGYRRDVGDGAGFDLGVIGYFYPGSEADLDWLEAFVSLSWGGFGVGASYSNDVFAADEYGVFLNLTYEHSLPQGFGIAVGGGQYIFHNAVFGDSLPSSYLTWSAGLTWARDAAELGVTYSGTDSDGETLFGDWAGHRVVVSLSASM